MSATMTSAEAAAQLGIHVTAVCQAARAGTIKGELVKERNLIRWRLDRASVAAYVPGSREDEATEGPVADYIAWMRLRGLRETTVYQTRRNLRRLAAAVGTDDLLTVTEQQLRAWRAGLETRLTHESVVAEMVPVRGFYRWALLEDLITKDPTLRVAKPRVHMGVPRPMPEGDLRRALEAADPTVRAILLLGAFCGLRAMEIAGLRWSHVIDQPSATMLLIADGKGGRQRLVPAAQLVLDGMRAAGGTDYVIPRGDGNPGPNKPQRIGSLANDHLRRLGIRHSLHTTRHRFATQLYATSNDLRMTQGMLGHASPATTSRYTAYSQPAAVEAVLRLAAG